MLRLISLFALILMLPVGKYFTEMESKIWMKWPFFFLCSKSKNKTTQWHWEKLFKRSCSLSCNISREKKWSEINHLINNHWKFVAYQSENPRRKQNQIQIDQRISQSSVTWCSDAIVNVKHRIVNISNTMWPQTNRHLRKIECLMHGVDVTNTKLETQKKKSNKTNKNIQTPPVKPQV